MAHKPTVSVIIPFFNAERFLAEAISSVFEQTFVDWELLLVDDGSTDQSAQLARQCADGNSDRVRYLEHAGHMNRGPSAARNLALDHAQGEYLAFLDADDVWMPHKLEQQVGILRDDPDCGLVYGAALNWFGWTGMDADRQKDYVEDVRVPTDQAYLPPFLAVPYLRRSVPVPCPSDMLMPRAALARIGRFEESFTGIYQVYEDQAFTIRVSLHCKIFVSSECWIKYRRHEQSSNALSKELGWKPSARRFFLEYVERYLAARGDTKGAVWRAVRRELLPFRHPIVSKMVSSPGQAMARTHRALRRAAGGLVTQKMRARLHRNGDKLRPERLWSTTPVSTKWGYDRGQPIDRYYIEKFLSANRRSIRGRVLEIGETLYTEKFGENRVIKAETLHYDEAATYRCDLTKSDGLPCDAFDCIICTQTLHVIYDMRAAIQTLLRMLKPGGILLATLPGISRVSPEDSARWGDFWRVTSLAAKKLFAEAAPERCIQIRTYGNVLTAISFLHGVAAEEMRKEELERYDPLYEVIVGVRVEKPSVRETDGRHLASADEKT